MWVMKTKRKSYNFDDNINLYGFKFYFTKHSKERIEERKVYITDIKRILLYHPEVTEMAGKVVGYRNINLSFIIEITSDKIIKFITVYKGYMKRLRVDEELRKGYYK